MSANRPTARAASQDGYRDDPAGHVAGVARLLCRPVPGSLSGSAP